jgi:thioredoxin reductase (NADPH)
MLKIFTLCSTTRMARVSPGPRDGHLLSRLFSRMKKQSERWGAELYTEDVEFVDISQRPFTVSDLA